MKTTLIIIALLFTNFLQAKELKFGVYTSDKPSAMYKKFKPVLEYLEKDLLKKGITKKIKLKIYPSYEKAIDGLVNSEYDFARFGPASYILAKEKNKNIKLLVMELSKNEKRFNGVFISKNDSQINNLSDLKNKKFAFGNDKSTIGRYLAQATLLENGINSKTLASYEYLGRHDKVALAVAKGDFNAGVVKESTFEKYKNRGIKSIKKFENVTKPWLVRQNLPVEIYNALKESMLNLKDEKILKMFRTNKFVETSDEEYHFVRKGMNLSKKF